LGVVAAPIVTTGNLESSMKSMAGRGDGTKIAACHISRRGCTSDSADLISALGVLGGNLPVPAAHLHGAYYLAKWAKRG
jgi:hypothetical protein